MRIAIIGAGYVGLCTAVCFAEKHEIVLIDKESLKVQQINNKESYIFEKDLDNLLNKAIESKNLIAKMITEKFHPFDLIFISVGTPAETDGFIDLKYVQEVSKTILARTNEFLFDNQQTLIVLRSTVIPGSTNLIFEEFETKKLAYIVFNPEFLSQGSAIFDTLHPNRIIIGSNSKIASDRLIAFYQDFHKGANIPILPMTPESAEFSKYIANAFLAMKISFANEVADLVEKVENANIEDIIAGIGLDPRISPYFLRAGIGFGGSCFPKDVKALIRFSENNSAETPELLSSVLKVNENRPFRVNKLLRKELGNLNNKIISILGLSFKPGTNDIREAPSLNIIQALFRAGAIIRVHDPQIKRIDLFPYKKFEVIPFTSVLECVKGADACLLLTEWPEYEKLDLQEITHEMKNKIFIDGRRVFVKREIPQDIRYSAIGSYLKREKSI